MKILMIIFNVVLLSQQSAFAGFCSIDAVNKGCKSKPVQCDPEPPHGGTCYVCSCPKPASSMDTSVDDESLQTPNENEVASEPQTVVLQSPELENLLNNAGTQNNILISIPGKPETAKMLSCCSISGVRCCGATCCR